MNINDISVSFPEDLGCKLEQDEEFFVIEDATCRRKVRFHDYNEIYKVEGLYEYIFYEILKCQSPQKVCGEILNVLEGTGRQVDNLNVLDVGAGNGMMGEELVLAGVNKVLGIDIIPEAREAQMRDRPDAYENYLVTDLTSLDEDTQESLVNEGFNCMTVVAALGFGDIPSQAFANGFNIIEQDGIVAFNIRDKYIDEPATSDFHSLIEAIEQENILEVCKREKYRHRLSLDGSAIDYYVIAGIKRNDIPQDMYDEVRS